MTTRAPILHVPATDARLAAMKRCLEDSREHSPDDYFELACLVRNRFTAEERARFDAIGRDGGEDQS